MALANLVVCLDYAFFPLPPDRAVTIELDAVEIIYVMLPYMERMAIRVQDLVEATDWVGAIHATIVEVAEMDTVLASIDQEEPFDLMKYQMMANVVEKYVPHLPTSPCQ